MCNLAQRWLFNWKITSSWLQSRALHWKSGVEGPCKSVKRLVDFWEAEFSSNNIPEPTESIYNLISTVLHYPMWEVKVQKHDCLELSDIQQKELECLCHRRLNREPVQYLVSQWEFCDVAVRVRPPVFIPRPETEQLARLAVRRLCRPNCRPPARLLEVGSGSGAISCSVLYSLPHVSALAVDRSPDACQLTMENARLNGVADRLKVLEDELTEDGLQTLNSVPSFDVVVSNPPYVPSAEVDQLEPEILRYEDRAALDGGEDGLSVVRHLLSAAGGWLRPGGSLLLEVDSRHPARIAELLRQPLRMHRVYVDFARQQRFVELVRTRDA